MPAEKLTLTVGQAMVKFFSVQYSESDGVEQKLFAGCFGIFGHGNMVGAGRALLQAELAVTIGLPQDVPADSFDWPVGPFDPRVWHVERAYLSPSAYAS